MIRLPTTYNPAAYNVAIGMAISGTSIPANTYIVALDTLRVLKCLQMLLQQVGQHRLLLEITTPTADTTVGYPYISLNAMPYMQFYAVETSPQTTSILVDPDFAQIFRHDMELYNLNTGTSIQITPGYTGFYIRNRWACTNTDNLWLCFIIWPLSVS